MLATSLDTPALYHGTLARLGFDQQRGVDQIGSVFHDSHSHSVAVLLTLGQADSVVGHAEDDLIGLSMQGNANVACSTVSQGIGGRLLSDSVQVGGDEIIVKLDQRIVIQGAMHRVQSAD